MPNDAAWDAALAAHPALLQDPALLQQVRWERHLGRGTVCCMLTAPGQGASRQQGAWQGAWQG